MKTKSKPVFKQKDAYCYVPDTYIISFLQKNYEMTLADAQTYVSGSGVTGTMFVELSDVKNPKTFNNIMLHAFFNAHPFIKKMAVVFNGEVV